MPSSRPLLAEQPEAPRARIVPLLANEGLAPLAKVRVQKQTMLGGLCHEGREVTTTLSPPMACNCLTCLLDTTRRNRASARGERLSFRVRIHRRRKRPPAGSQ